MGLKLDNMLGTFHLLELYLKECREYQDVSLHEYNLNGTVITLRFSYKPGYEWDKDYVSNDIETVELLDYITWVFSKCSTTKI